MRGRQRRHARIAIPVILGLGVLYGALSLRTAPRTPAAATAGILAPRAGDPHSARASAMIRAGSEATASLVETYGSWAGERAALPARQLVLRALFRRIDGPFGVESVLAAIEADPTAPADDPLWNELIELLASGWRGARADRGLDLLVAESRPRVRRVLIASFAHLVDSERSDELTQEQRQRLVNHLIDLSPGLTPEQQPEVDQALRALASDDVADILLGRGLATEDELDGPRGRKLALAEAQRNVAPSQPDEGQTSAH